jgi:hypothetical protein
MPKKPSARNCDAGMAAFSISRSTMAVRLIAFDSALRTRTSLSGFLIFAPSLAVMNGVSSRQWSMWK